MRQPSNVIAPGTSQQHEMNPTVAQPSSRYDIAEHVLLSGTVAMYAPEAVQFWTRLRELIFAMGPGPLPGDGDDDDDDELEEETANPTVTRCEFYSTDLAGPTRSKSDKDKEDSSTSQ